MTVQLVALLPCSKKVVSVTEALQLIKSRSSKSRLCVKQYTEHYITFILIFLFFQNIKTAYKPARYYTYSPIPAES